MVSFRGELEKNNYKMTESSKQDNNQIKVKKRNPFIAFLFSLLTPGLGQIYNGQLVKGIILFLIPHTISFIFEFNHWFIFFVGLISFFLIQAAIHLYIIIDSIIIAFHRKDYVLKIYNHWIIYLLIVVIMLISVPFYYFTYSNIGIEAYEVSTDSNRPTLQIGDCIVADTKAFNDNKVEYGDIVVFDSPLGDKYISRVIGLPEDEIEIKDSVIKINGRMLKTRFVCDTMENNYQMIVDEEELPNGRKHKIYRKNTKYHTPYICDEKISLPTNCYYLLSDNRDIGIDSKNFGYIRHHNILSKVVYSYIGLSFDRINIDFRER